MSHSSLRDFKIEKRLGSGSFGVVYRVLRLKDSKNYVLKAVRIAEMDHKEKLEAINEVKLLAQMDSQFVVKYYDSFLESDTLHIIMEYCNRGDLSLLLKKTKKKGLRQLPVRRIWEVFVQICLGLHYIHSRRVLHRDVKAANVFVSKDEVSGRHAVKIGDLGVARLLGSSASFASTVVGTPYCLSPELCENQPYNSKSDVWAVGVILYQCCGLRHPFEANNQCALILKIIRGHFEPLQGVDEDLVELVQLLLTRDQDVRPTVAQVLGMRSVQRAARESGLEIPSDVGCAIQQEEENTPVEPESRSNSNHVQNYTQLTHPIHPNGELGGGRHLAKRFQKPAPRTRAQPTKGANSVESTVNPNPNVRGRRVRGGGPRTISQVAKAGNRRSKARIRPPRPLTPTPESDGDLHDPSDDDTDAAIGSNEALEVKMAYNPSIRFGEATSARNKPTIADLRAALEDRFESEPARDGRPSVCEVREIKSTHTNLGDEDPSAVNMEQANLRVPASDPGLDPWCSSKSAAADKMHRTDFLRSLTFESPMASNTYPFRRSPTAGAAEVVVSTKHERDAPLDMLSFHWGSSQDSSQEIESSHVLDIADADTDTDCDCETYPAQGNGQNLGRGAELQDGVVGSSLEKERNLRLEQLEIMSCKVEEIRTQCLSLLGEDCFWQLYDELANYWKSAEGAEAKSLSKECESEEVSQLNMRVVSRCEDLAVAQTGSIVTACEAIFHVQRLLAHEAGVMEAREAVLEILDCWQMQEEDCSHRFDGEVTAPATVWYPQDRAADILNENELAGDAGLRYPMHRPVEQSQHRKS